MNATILGIGMLVIIMATLVGSLIIGLALVKLLEISIARGACVIHAWLQRTMTARRT